MFKSTSRPRVPTTRCPHCDSRAMTRSSNVVTPLYREIRLRCENDECGHQFLIAVSVIRTILPSRTPNPAIVLPVSNPNLTRPRPGNDDNRTPANDNVVPAADRAPAPG